MRWQTLQIVYIFHRWYAGFAESHMRTEFTGLTTVDTGGVNADRADVSLGDKPIGCDGVEAGKVKLCNRLAARGRRAKVFFAVRPVLAVASS